MAWQGIGDRSLPREALGRAPEVKRELKEAEANVKIKNNQVTPRNEQRTRASSVRGRTLRQMPARQGNSVVCETLSRADGEAVEIRVL